MHAKLLLPFCKKITHPAALRETARKKYPLFKLPMFHDTLEAELIEVH